MIETGINVQGFRHEAFTYGNGARQDFLGLLAVGIRRLLAVGEIGGIRRSEKAIRAYHYQRLEMVPFLEPVSADEGGSATRAPILGISLLYGKKYLYFFIAANKTGFPGDPERVLLSRGLVFRGLLACGRGGLRYRQLQHQIGR